MKNCKDGCKHIIEGSKELHDGIYIDCSKIGKMIELDNVPKFFKCKYFEK